MAERRRLRLMNEVLPDPMQNRVASADGAARARAGGPRDRTMMHMQALLASAAAATAVAGCGATDEAKPESGSASARPEVTSATPPGSAPSIAPKDPTPPASASATAVASASAAPSSSAAPSASAVASTKPPITQPTAPPTRTPYIVVDPMPPPYRNGKTGPNHP